MGPDRSRRTPQRLQEHLFAEAKVPMHTLSNYGAVLTEAEKIGYITPDLKPLLDEWRKDPAHWRQ